MASSVFFMVKESRSDILCAAHRISVIPLVLVVFLAPLVWNSTMLGQPWLYLSLVTCGSNGHNLPAYHNRPVSEGFTPSYADAFAASCVLSWFLALPSRKRWIWRIPMSSSEIPMNFISSYPWRSSVGGLAISHTHLVLVSLCLFCTSL